MSDHRPIVSIPAGQSMVPAGDRLIAPSGVVSVGDDLVLSPDTGQQVIITDDALNARMTVDADVSFTVTTDWEVRVGVARRFYLTNTTFQLKYAPNLEFSFDTVNPTIIQEVRATGSGYTTSLLAQSTKDPGTETGGALDVASGGYGGSGSGDISSGDAAFHPGATNGAGVQGTVYIGIDSANTALYRAYDTILDAVNKVEMRTGGSGVLRFKVLGSALQSNVALLYYLKDVAAPTFGHQVDNGAGAAGDDLEIYAQDVSDAAGNATAGNLGLRGGQGLVHANNLDGNVWFHVAPVDWQDSEKIIFVADAVTAPTDNPADGGYLYSASGAGTWWGSGGTVTAFGPSKPRCSACGYDHWRHVSVNARFGSYVLECGMCGKVYRKGAPDVRSLLTAAERDELVYDDDDATDPRPPHKKRDVITSVAGTRARRKRVAPTLQEYRDQSRRALVHTPPVLVDVEVDVMVPTGLLDDDGAPILAPGKAQRAVVDQDATRQRAAARLAQLRSDWAAPIASWHEHYQGLDDGAALGAQLDDDVAAIDAEVDEDLADRTWGARAPDPDDEV